MLCAVYKSKKKADSYLYINKKDDFSQVPESLLQIFGQPQFVMLIPVNKRERLGGMPKQVILDKLESEGFYLQLPPKVESLLEQHRASLVNDSSTGKASS
ncbi:YcgL domain-containing protein [Ningiella sp. W23]|uniref:YcgL domain-containing protein n=1 Tax=Ningiella sp. W23 TaxID=3023715 RepID=UPI0037572EAB